jgi:hypothetical protein
MGGGSDVVPPIQDPIMLPHETDSEDFEPPDNAIIDTTTVLAIEENQVDVLKIYNLDVRGNRVTNGTLTSNQFFGLNMAQKISIAGESLNGKCWS